jgi:uncharacterized protein YdhG (YjbR/CyaY superfamily)
MTNRSAPTSIDAYITQFPPETQEVLAELRALIRATAPDTTERISYGIPTFDLNGRYLVYLAGWKHHVALYPVTPAMEQAFEDELAPYRTSKGTLRFPLGQPMPTHLIRRIVEVRVREVVGKTK